MSLKTMGVLFSISVVVGSPGHAQNTASLFDQILKADQEFFAAFNTCDLARMGEIFTKDLEFYHDLGGLDDYAQTMEAGKKNCDRELGLRRELVEGSLEVHPISGFGAVQTGEHTFCHLENGQNVCGTFEFLHVWKITEGGWRIARVVSYGH